MVVDVQGDLLIMYLCIVVYACSLWHIGSAVGLAWCGVPCTVV
jgi:hypothetical protein